MFLNKIRHTCNRLYFSLKIWFPVGCRKWFCVSIKAAIFLSFLLITGSIVTPGIYAGDLETPAGDIRGEQWHITADELSYDSNFRQYMAKGNVRITKEGKTLTADQARYDRENMKAYASGNVIMKTGEDLLTGNYIEIDLNTETGILYYGTVFIKEDHFYIKGDHIQKTGESTYTIDRSTITTCDGDSPAWKISARHVEIAMDGYGYARHATLWAKKVPVLYTPYLFFPVKRERKTGLLSPSEMGLSNRNGIEFEQPFFWAINNSSDATFYWYHLQKRGEKIGTEYRLVMDEESKVTIKLDYLDDRRTDDGVFGYDEDGNYELNSEKKWGYQDDQALRTNSDRYWLRMMYIQKHLPLDFSSRFELDIVSDQDYLNEFKEGETGFDDTDEYYLDNFGSGVEEYNEERRNKLNLYKKWTNYTLNIDLKWMDDPYRRSEGEKDWYKKLIENETDEGKILEYQKTIEELDKDTTLRKELPYVAFDSSKYQILDSPFYYKLDSEYRYFYRKDDNEPVKKENNSYVLFPKGHRADLYPRFYLPMEFRHYFTFEPSVGLRETAWYGKEKKWLDEPDDSNMDTPDVGQENKSYHRELYDLQADLSTAVFSVFDTDGFYFDAMKHAIEPAVTYSFKPDIDQDKYPGFDSLDKIEKENKITYSLTNRLVSKKRIINKFNNGNAENSDPEYTYNDKLLKFKLSQEFDINALNKGEHSLSNLKGDIDFIPSDYFSLDVYGEWSPYKPYKQLIVERNIKATISDKRKDSFYIEHKWARDNEDTDERDAMETIMIGFNVVCSDRISLFSGYQRDIEKGVNVEFNLGMRYRAQCWSLEVNYEDDGDDHDDQRLFFVVNLLGIGEVKSNYKMEDE
ncbi:MAG: LPS-assembly protein LptD [Desulfobacterales bacterium]|nr:LPS-assembly protein LptD [Desulfobacterales bacterium]